MSNLYKFVLDETNSLLKVYNNDVLLVDVPFGIHSPAFVVDTFFSVPYLDGTYVDVIFAGTGLEFQNYSFDLSGLFSAIQVGTYFDFYVWDTPTYTTEIFHVFKGVDGTYTPVPNETNMTFDTVSAVSVGLTYVATAPAVTCDFTQLLLRFDSIDSKLLSIETQINTKFLEFYDAIYSDLSYLKSSLSDNLGLIKSDTLNILGYSENVFAPAFLTLATKTDLESITIDTTNLATKTDIGTISLNMVSDADFASGILNLATKTDLSGITVDTTNLATKTDISSLAHYDVSNIILPSLNGNGSEFIDGVEVKVFGRDTVYTVDRSFMSLYSDNGYTVHYDLTSVDGYKCTVPEALLTKHVVAV